MTVALSPGWAPAIPAAKIGALAPGHRVGSAAPASSRTLSG